MSGVIDVKLAENDSNLCIELAPGFRDDISVTFVQEDNNGLPVQFADIGKDGKNGVSPQVIDGTWWTWNDETGEFADTGVAASGGGSIGRPGKDGVTFTPSVDGEGNLSWTNDGGLDNPQTVKIKGDPGKDGSDGKDGLDGPAGRDGVSATHTWNGTTLTVTSASGTSSADLKGERGEDGTDGEPGVSGVYIGTEEPTDETVTVWFNPDGKIHYPEGVETMTADTVREICR